MTQQKTLITTDIDYDKGGYQVGVLCVPYSHDKSAYGRIQLPVSVLKKGEGLISAIDKIDHNRLRKNSRIH